MRILLTLILLKLTFVSFSQLTWQNVDSLYAPLPASVHIYYTIQSIDTAPFRAFYLIADLKDKQLNFTTDTTLNRRLSPTGFFEKNASPLVVVNGTFFSFETNRNLNVVVKEGKIISHSMKSIKEKTSDSSVFYYPLRSAIGINKKRRADVARIFTDSTETIPYAFRETMVGQQAIASNVGINYFKKMPFMRGCLPFASLFGKHGNKPTWKWRMVTAIGGGPMLVHDGGIEITNEQERMFTGKAINDKHPRTAMGYTKENKLIILVVEGRSKVSGGASLTQEAQILKDLGCVEALNLDGGGSSCLLINGKETITPSDKGVQRAVPAVFMIMIKK